MGVLTVTTQAVTNISNPFSTATGNGTITDIDANASERGFVYSVATHAAPGNVTLPNSLYESSVTESGSFGIGSFTGALVSLNLQPPSAFTIQIAIEDNNYAISPGWRIQIRVYSYYDSTAGRVYSATYLESDVIGSDNEYWLGSFAWNAVAGVTGYRVLLNVYTGEGK